MFKKCKLAALCLVCAISLSGCWVPVLKKEVTLPFFEKKGEEALDLMFDKMANIGTMEYDTKLLFNVHINPAKMQNSPISFLDRSQTRVLGIDNIAQAEMETYLEDNFSQEIYSDFDQSLDMPMASPGMDIPFFSPGPMDIAYNFSMAGKIDQTNKDNIKNQGKFDIDFEIQGMSIKLSADLITIGDEIYIKVSELPFPFSMLIGNEFSNQWYAINLKEIEEMEREIALEEGKAAEAEFNYEEYKEKSKRVEEELKELIKNSNILRLDERLKDEEINGKKCYHYRISLDKSKIGGLIEGAVNIFNHELNDIDPIIFHGLTEDPKFKKFLAQLEKIIKQADGELWIDKDDFYLHKSTFNLNVDFSGFEIDGETVPQDALAFSVTARMDYKNFNQPVTIEAPAGSKSIMEIINQEREKSRNAKRISDIKQIQTALELYYNDNDKYPDRIKNSEDFTYYIYYIPENPKYADGECAKEFEYVYMPIEDYQSYELRYCISQDIGGVKAGYNIATPYGISEENINRNLDTDLDGLFDWEELEVYLTDPKNSDTDGDGFLDGDEVKNGYNPNGVGKLNSILPEDNFTLIKSGNILGIDFSICNKVTNKTIYFGLGSTNINIYGKDNKNNCLMNYATEIEMGIPNLYVCNVPVLIGKQEFEITDNGIDFSSIEDYCEPLNE